MNATQPLKILMPPGRRRDDSEKPQSAADLFTRSEKEKGRNCTLAFDNQHAFRDDRGESLPPSIFDSVTLLVVPGP